MRTFVGLILALAAVAILGLGYLGFIPVVAGVFGSDQPRDLGIKSTAADLQNANTKTGVRLAELPPSTNPAGSIRYTGQVAVNQTFTDEELTALAGNAKWKYNPFTNVQIKIGSDGTLETSGILRVERLRDYAAGTGISSDVVNTVMDSLRLVPNSTPPFYLRCTGSVTNNHVNIDIQQLEIGRFAVPGNLISDNRGAITGFLDDKIKKIPGLSVRSATLSNGQIKFDGTLPAEEATVRN